MKKIIWALAITAGMLAGCDDDDDNNNISEQDRSFIVNAGYANLNEIDAGTLATTKGATEGVRTYGQMMVTEHDGALDELRTIANDKEVNLPGSPDPAHQQLRQTLMNLSGYSFDSAYMKSQITDHQNTIALFETEVSNGKDSRTKNYAEKYLPHIRVHLEKADSIFNVLIHNPD